MLRHVIFLFLSLGITANIFATCCGKNFVAQNIKIGDALYLKGCGGNPQEYFEKPLIFSNFHEVPNLVVSLEESSYHRPLQTSASSVINLENANLTVTLNNFRDLTIVDSEKQILAQRKITGATSLYEIKLNGSNVAWAVGWNHHIGGESDDKSDCRSGDDDNIAVFSILRIYFPTIQNGEVVIEEKLVSGLDSYDQKLVKSTEAVLLTDKRSLGFGYDQCSYCLPNFIKLDPKHGFIEIDNLAALNEFIDTEHYFAPLFLTLWLIGNNNINDLKNYIDSHYQQVHDEVMKIGSRFYEDMPEDIYEDAQKRKQELIARSNYQNCKISLDRTHYNNNREAVVNILEGCFPLMLNTARFNWWIP